MSKTSCHNHYEKLQETDNYWQQKHCASLHSHLLFIVFTNFMWSLHAVVFVIWYAVILFQYRCYLRRREKDYSNNITFSEWTCYLCQPLRNILKIDLTEMMACPKKVVKLIQFSLQLLLLLLLAGIYRTIIVWRSTLEFNFFWIKSKKLLYMSCNIMMNMIELKFLEMKWKCWNHKFDRSLFCQ